MCLHLAYPISTTIILTNVEWYTSICSIFPSSIIDNMYGIHISSSFFQSSKYFNLLSLFRSPRINQWVKVQRISFFSFISSSFFTNDNSSTNILIILSISFIYGGTFSKNCVTKKNHSNICALGCHCSNIGFKEGHISLHYFSACIMIDNPYAHLQSYPKSSKTYA